MPKWNLSTPYMLTASAFIIRVPHHYDIFRTARALQIVSAAER
jgi:hypothetical protein